MTTTTTASVLQHIAAAAREMRAALAVASTEPDAIGERRLDAILLNASRLERLHASVDADEIIRRTRRQA